MRKILLLITFISGSSLVTFAKNEAANSPLASYHPTPAPVTATLLLKKGDRLAICGDSITEQKIYSRIIEDYLTACMPQLKVSVRQFGWGGERADGFLKRMTNDCLRFEPTIATTCYGMNDHEYRPYEQRIGDTYEKYSRAVVEAFKSHGVRVVQGSSGCVGERTWWQAGATSDALNHNLCELRNIGITVAQDEKVAFADVFWPMLQATYLSEQKYGPNYKLSGGDGVHPNWAGHTVMAYAFLKALGIDGQIASFKVNLNKGTMTVSDGHALLKARDGEFTIRSERYPFCSGAPMGLAANWYPTTGTENITNSDNIRSGMTLVPFNDELNRFMLTVDDANEPKYRVAWGIHSAVFTGEQLRHGINLAAEFPANPFSTKFALIDAAVDDKQEFETRQVKNLFRPSKADATMAEITAQTDRVVKDTEKEHAALEAVVRAAYAPVTYTLKISAE
ncbi:MAG TPA: SGNH/GDSL hydrolase family protein [Verrucomicrobiae bacterium]|jgi:lysophospholipase L1-like esterase|nr:SGNH/GDSL hydrolase family protein [Verrucomicrobiae bacterium]